MSAHGRGGFKKPRKIVDCDLVQQSQAFGDSGGSGTESTEDMDIGIEECARGEIRDWLSTHGQKLFALESSKFLAISAKKLTSKQSK